MLLAELSRVERLVAGQYLGRERLVDFDQPQTIHRQPTGPFECDRRGHHGTETHAGRIATGEGPRANPARAPDSPSSRARRADASTSAAAPSVICEAFPAVTVPYLRSKIGRSLARASRVWFSRIPLSLAAAEVRTAVRSAPERPLPACVPRPTRLRRADGCVTRNGPGSRVRAETRCASTSAVWPMFRPEAGSVSPELQADQRREVAWAETRERPPASPSDLWPGRVASTDAGRSGENSSGICDIDSTAPATTRSASPARMR